ncbi:MAG TPA: hypothetical protein DDY43_04820 [Synechococcales bacterium UBA10510]|jgi:hypothetical protein|nr:hypothetical protein [Synechococcales bacterium UBA10510]
MGVTSTVKHPITTLGWQQIPTVARVPCLTTALATLLIAALAAIRSATAETALARSVAGGWLPLRARASL